MRRLGWISFGLGLVMADRSQFLHNRLMRMGRLLPAILVASVCSLVANQARASAIYDFVPYGIPAGYAVNGGTITVTDTAAADGILGLSEIESFSLDVT